ncbi:MAG TPA: hypothetical protein PKB06_10825, partial [Actinotalea sp.]|nr:hypothetical protein [Actinotalea sp.]
MSEAQGTVPTVLHVSEVDGIPAVWADVPGPLTAGLLIRMGYADEALVHRGHSHMLEHLALFGLGRPGNHSNGHVDATSTLLHASGSPEEVGSFLEQVARQLVDPPPARLEDEKGVLRAEHSRRGPHPLSELAVWRWGMRDFGLETAEELGLAAMTADSVRAWSRRFVTRQNAALWLTGPPPAGLRLALPDGDRVPAPDPWRTTLPFLPAVIRLNSPVIAWHGLVPRDWNGPPLAMVVNNRLVDELRTSRAAAYSPQGGYQPLNGDVAALLAFSDAVDGKEAEVVDRVLGVVGE